MRRADRLFQIIQLLRGRGRARTAKWLAEQLEVSERTVYRDVRDLMVAGTPIEGEAGVGYRLRNYDLPPLMFDVDEIEALVLGAHTVQAFGDEALARAAAAALSKIEAVLPERLRPRLGAAALFAPRADSDHLGSERLFAVRAALGAQHKLRVRYRRADGDESQRVIRPLGAFFWGRSWTLTAWCEMRCDFRNFRLDRILTLESTQEPFTQQPGQTLRDYLRTIGPAAEGLLED
jgi:predicted DNA-binding transcriptional regulator YafY